MPFPRGNDILYLSIIKYIFVFLDIIKYRYPYICFWGWGTDPKGEGANLLFWLIFPENCRAMKKNLDREGGASFRSLISAFYPVVM